MRRIKDRIKDKGLTGKETSVCTIKKKIKRKKSKRGRPVGFKMSAASKLAISAALTGHKTPKRVRTKISTALLAYYSCLHEEGFVVARVIVHKSDKRAMAVLKGRKRKTPPKGRRKKK